MRKLTIASLALLLPLMGNLHAQFAGFLPIDFSDASDSASAQWEDFDVIFGPPGNQPDVSTTNPGSFVLTGTQPNVLLASSGNIYSFSDLTSFTIDSSLDTFTPSNLVLQIRTLGATVDTDSFMLAYTDNDGAMQTMAPNFIELVENVPDVFEVPGIGTFSSLNQVYAVQWDLSDPLDTGDYSILGDDAFTLSFNALNTSMSLDAARIDFGSGFTPGGDFLASTQFVVPEPTTAAVLFGGLGLLALRRRRASTANR
ncbi:MAG: PEP-CTERM sorting domain-containing protein [Verrucomicrobiota bacterium]